MKMTIILNGVKVQKEIPMGWKKVTFDQFLKLAECGKDISKVLALFTGIEADILRKAKIINFDVIRQTLQFLETELKYPIPETVLGHKIPKNLEMETIGQFEDLKKECSQFTDNQMDNIKKYPLIVATYCVDPYDWMEAEKLATSFFNAPCQEVLAIGNFTLVKLIESKANTKPIYRQGDTVMSRLRLAMRAWRRNTVFSVRWFLWKRRLRSLGLNS